MTVKTAPYQAKDYSRLLGTKGFSDTLLKNHFTLYQGYVANTNKLLDAIAELPKDGKNPNFAELSRRLGFEWNGMRLHEHYFEQMGGNGKISPGGKLQKKLSDEFGGFEDWEKAFRATGGIKGVGWAALYHDPAAGRCINFWINEHHVSHPSGCQLLLVMDVWEHAFMTDYGLDRASYIDAFMKAVNWEIVEQRLAQ